MLKRWLRRILIALAILLVLVGIGGFIAYRYVIDNGTDLLEDLARENGYELTIRHLDYHVWEEYPIMSIDIAGVELSKERNLFRADSVYLEVSADRLLDNVLEVQRIVVRDADIRVVRDTVVEDAGVGSVSSLAPAFIAPFFKWNGVGVSLRDVAVQYLQPQKGKDISGRARAVELVAERASDEKIRLKGTADLRVDQLLFNPEKGAYLRDTDLSGPVHLTIDEYHWTLAPTPLAIGEQAFRVGAVFDRRPDSLIILEFESDSADFARTVELLPRNLREKIEPYFVDTPFRMCAYVKTPTGPGSNPLIELDFELTGQAVKLNQYQFRNAHARGSFVNRLTPAEGALADPRKNLRFVLEDVRTDWNNIHVETPAARVAVAGKSPIYRGPAHFSGPARGVSDYLQNKNFFFRGGRFTLDTEVDANLLSLIETTETTDGTLRFTDTDVIYRPAGVRFGFEEIEVAKYDGDVSFLVDSRPLPTGFAFVLEGTADNLTPLLIDRPGEQITTDVKLTSGRIDWTDFRALFGPDGEFNSDESVATAAGTDAIKSTLLGLAQTFQPTIDARFDTVAYYDVFELNNLTTGLHFTGDTFVLERTTFDWAGSDLTFGARLDLAPAPRTPFAVDLAAEHLDLNQLRPTLEYFGTTLPAGIDSLPSDLHVDFSHRGRLDDATGVAPGFNRGRVSFDDGRHRLFSGELSYAPGPLGLASNLQLNGDPRVVNVITGAENFFFDGGHFALRAELPTPPADLAELVRTATINLAIDSSRVSYPAAGVAVPVRRFHVGLADRRADYDIQLLTDSTDRAVYLNGAVDDLAAFLLPGADRNYRIRADLSAETLGWSDLADFLIFETADEADTTGVDPQAFLSATSGIFDHLRPDLSLVVDTLLAGGGQLFTNLRAGLSMRDSTTLVLERTGFDLGSGHVELAATYPLDERMRSPFAAEFELRDFSLEELRKELDAMDLPSLEALGDFSGRVTLTGDVTGMMDEDGQKILIDSTEGRIDYDLTDLVLEDWPQLDTLGRKLFMRKRFRRLAFAPLSGTLQLRNGKLPIPRTELQSTALQLFVEGSYDLEAGPDILVTVPVWPNIGRGVLEKVPTKTGYEAIGWKVFLMTGADAGAGVKTKFRLGRKRWDERRR